MPPKSDLSLLNCSLARALASVGDWWSLLIVRHALLGASRFAHFQSGLGIARNILAKRLIALVAADVLERSGPATRPTYHLTEKGLALTPALIALMQWGDHWESADRPPVIFSDRAGEPIAPVGLFTCSGKPTSARDLSASAGPGATATTAAFLSAQRQRKASTT